SGRIGELDILMVPFVVGAVGRVGGRREREKRAESREQAGGLGVAAVRSVAALPMALPAAVLATGAALTKGPPGVLVIALAAYFPAVLVHRRGGQSSKLKAESSNPEGASGPAASG